MIKTYYVKRINFIYVNDNTNDNTIEMFTYYKNSWKVNPQEVLI